MCMYKMLSLVTEGKNSRSLEKLVMKMAAYIPAFRVRADCNSFLVKMTHYIFSKFCACVCMVLHTHMLL